MVQLAVVGIGQVKWFGLIVLTPGQPVACNQQVLQGSPLNSIMANILTTIQKRAMHGSAGPNTFF